MKFWKGKIMKSRQEIKALAKEAVSHQRGTAILIIFLWWVIYLVSMLVSGIPFIGWLISLALTAFILMALLVNIDGGAFIKIYRKETVTVREPFEELKVNFFRKVGGVWWMMLFVWLWSLLLVVPGIIKALAYSMTHFILAEYPNVHARQALKLSMKMTAGHKGKLFVLGLSFIGWMMLSGLTFGILYFVYVGPYMYSTFAGFYTELRDKALADGVIDASELA